MPKKLKVSSNQRVDIGDFNRAASDFSDESLKFQRNKLWASTYAAVVGGFRIEIADQSTNPGQFTIYNGLAIDKDGALLNNEDQVNDSRTYTLSGTESDFYIEIEFTETESDVDVRAFWDPTFSGSTPPGQEFTQNVATRLSPDWQVYTPIDTTAFAVDNDRNTTRIPIAVLSTNSSNEIITSTEYYPSTTLTRGIGSSDTTLWVADSTLLSSSGTATLLHPTSGATASVTVAADGNDRVNGVITLAAGPGQAFPAGSILRDTQPAAERFIEESTAARPASGRDRRARFFAGDEERGTGLVHSKFTPGDKDDLDIQSLKDYVDFLASQLHEVKYGRLSPSADPSNYTGDVSSTVRYYDYAGSVAGSTIPAVTIGDGTVSRGDFVNSANLGTAISDAQAVLPASGGLIYVKEGSYTWGATQVTWTKEVKLVFAPGVTLVGGSYVSPLMTADSALSFTMDNFPKNATFSSAVEVLDVPSGTANVEVTNSYMGLYSGGAGNFIAKNCLFEGRGDGSTVALSLFNTTTLLEDCDIRYNGTFSVTPVPAASPSLSNYLVLNQVSESTIFRRCTFDCSFSTGGLTGWVYNNPASSINDLRFEECVFTRSNTAAATFGNGMYLYSVDDIGNLEIKNCKFEASNFYNNPGTTLPDGEGSDYQAYYYHELALIAIDAPRDLTRVSITECDFKGIDQQVFVDPIDTDRLAYNLVYTQGGNSGTIGFVEFSNNTFGLPYVDGTTEGTLGDLRGFMMQQYVVGGLFTHQQLNAQSSSTDPGHVEIVGNTATNATSMVSIAAFETVIVKNNSNIVRNTSTAPSCVDYDSFYIGGDILVVEGNRWDEITSSAVSSANGTVINAYLFHSTAYSALVHNNVVILKQNAPTTATGTGRVGVDVLAGSSAEKVNVNVSGNIVEIDHNSGSLSGGLLVRSLDNAVFDSNFVVSGNSISVNAPTQSGAGPSGGTIGLYVTPLSPFSPEISVRTTTVISDNTVKLSLESYANGASFTGLSIPQCKYATVSGNTIVIRGEENANDLIDCWGIHALNPYNSSIVSNSVLVYLDQQVIPKSTPTTNSGFSAGISTNNVYNIGQNVKISNNTVMSEGLRSGIHVVCANLDISYFDIVVNNVRWVARAGYSADGIGGIVVQVIDANNNRSADYCNVSNNTVYANPDGGTASDSATGIGLFTELSGQGFISFLHAKVHNNLIRIIAQSSQSDPATAGLRTQGCLFSSVCLNSIDATNVQCILIQDCEELTLAFNVIGWVSGIDDIAIYGSADVNAWGNGTESNSADMAVGLHPGASIRTSQTTATDIVSSWNFRNNSVSVNR